MLRFVVFSIGPILAGLALSFASYDALSPPKWVGIANYANILFGTEESTHIFWRSVVNTMYFAVGQVGLEMISGLALALLANARLLRAKTMWRIFFYTPVITSTIASALIWLWLYNVQVGLFNTILTGLGLPTLRWLVDPKLAMLCVIIMSTWAGAGWSMVVYLAGLQGIPESLYEAARIDGANGWQQFWKVTLPLLMPVTFFIVIMGFIGSLQVFGQVYVMTQGGPIGATMTITYHIYNTAFQYYRLGYASAMSFLLFLLILFFSVLNYRFFGGRVEY